MVNKLILHFFSGCILLSVTILMAFAFVISPSQIDVPVLSNGTNFVIDLVSDAQLSLLRTNCTIVTVALDSNHLTLSTSPFAVSDSQECVVSVNEYGKPSVSFDFALFIDIKTSLFANMTVTYDEEQLAITNKGTGVGRLWVNASSSLAECLLNPGESCRYLPKGIAVVCEDVKCIKQIFVNEFKNNGDVSVTRNSDIEERQSGLMVIVFIATGIVVLIISGLYYFTRRNRALLKNTS